MKRQVKQIIFAITILASTLAQAEVDCPGRCVLPVGSPYAPGGYADYLWPHLNAYPKSCRNVGGSYQKGISVNVCVLPVGSPYAPGGYADFLWPHLNAYPESCRNVGGVPTQQCE